MMQTTLPQETANQFLRAGIGVIPVKFRDKRPDLGEWRMYQERLPKDTELQRWFGGRLHNIGIVTGWAGLAVLDFDDMSIYSRWLVWSARKGGLAQFTARSAFRVKTSRGMHVYIRLPEIERNHKLPGIDVKAAGGYVVGPGSVHPSGAVYEPQSAFILPKVNALSDVIPAALLVQTKTPDFVRLPLKVRPTPIDFSEYDPWAVAERTEAEQFSVDLITRIRQSLRVEEFFPEAKSSSRDGRWKMAKCPFHPDHHPSFWLDTERQICGCHACQMKAMDVINLYGRLHGLDNLTAIYELRKLV